MGIHMSNKDYYFAFWVDKKSGYLMRGCFGTGTCGSGYYFATNTPVVDDVLVLPGGTRIEVDENGNFDSGVFDKFKSGTCLLGKLLGQDPGKEKVKV